MDVIGYQIEAGHSIEVTISPTYWPQIWPDKEIVNLIVDFSHSELLLPVINDFNEVRLKYEQSETAAPLEKEIIRDGYRTRNVIKKLTTDEWVLDDFSDEGLRTLTETNITYGSTNHNVYTIKEGDPLSAKVECDWTVQVKDSDIDTNVVTKSVMSCDADNYYLYNEMTGYSNNEQCFYKTWNKTVPRYYT